MIKLSLTALPGFLALGLLAGGHLLFSTVAAETGEDAGPSTRELDPNQWNGQVGEDETIPEFGHVIAVGDASIQFCVWQNRLRLYFLDEEDKVLDPDASLATVRLVTRREQNRFIRMLPRGKYLESSELIRPPHTFFVVLNIHRDGEDTEAHTFQFSQRSLGFGDSD